MKTEKNILIAFMLNLAFSIFEFWGGIVTGSVAILSDAVHDIADAASIGISWILEKKSRKQPDEQYSYGYARYSVLGGLITTLILLSGSITVIYRAVIRILNPTEINYTGMIFFAMIGICVNLAAALFTHKGSSLNQKAVNLHMLEDVLGWIVVLVGAVTMKLTDFTLIDPIMSIGVAGFILINASRNLKQIFDLFLEKTPRGVEIDEIKSHLLKLEGILDVHHIHIWSMDGEHHLATMHIVTESDPRQIKQIIRQELQAYHIDHVTLELERTAERCSEERCCAVFHIHSGHHHH